MPSGSRVTPSRSSICCSRRRALSRTISVTSRWVVFRRPGTSSSSRFEPSRIAVIGVLSSWDMWRRKRDFFASRSPRRWRSHSRRRPSSTKSCGPRTTIRSPSLPSPSARIALSISPTGRAMIRRKYHDRLLATAIRASACQNRSARVRSARARICTVSLAASARAAAATCVAWRARPAKPTMIASRWPSPCWRESTALMRAESLSSVAIRSFCDGNNTRNAPACFSMASRRSRYACHSARWRRTMYCRAARSVTSTSSSRRCVSSVAWTVRVMAD